MISGTVATVTLASGRPMRVFALSDIHVDYAENMQWIRDLSRFDFQDAALILAGDVTHDLGRLEEALTLLEARFRHLFFVPGNHELWVMKGERGNSLDKFRSILELCALLGVHCEPMKIGAPKPLWIVPLFSWYATPEEGSGSLYLPKRGGDQGMKVWSDTYFVKWPQGPAWPGPANHFLALNHERVARTYDAPVLSFSHFISRQDLLFPHGTDVEAIIRRAQEEAPALAESEDGDGFNFSRVAGTRALETQIRALGSKVHVHGHQHRNRFRRVDGILYVSHCLGYKHERQRGMLDHVEAGPLLIWDEHAPWQDPLKQAY